MNKKSQVKKYKINQTCVFLQFLKSERRLQVYEFKMIEKSIGDNLNSLCKIG